MTDPIESMATVAARRLKQWNPYIRSDVDEIRFTLAYWFNYYGVIVITLLIGLLSHHVINCAMALIALSVLRQLTGGYHFKSLTVCAIVSVIFAVVSAFLDYAPVFIEILNLVAFGIVVSCVGKGRNKTAGLIVIASNMIYCSPVIATAFIIQALSILKGGDTHEKNHRCDF